MTIARKIRILIIISALLVTGASVIFLGPPPALQAQTREEVVLWQSIKDSDHASDYLAYLDKYPDGTFAPLAKRRIVEFTTIIIRGQALISARPGSISFDQCKDSESLTSDTQFSLSAKAFLLAYAYVGAKRGDSIIIEWSSDGKNIKKESRTYNSPDQAQCDTGAAFINVTSDLPTGKWRVTVRVNGIEFLTIPFTVTEN
jgi:hypothetical protein